jgi:hypothetical protein
LSHRYGPGNASPCPCDVESRETFLPPESYCSCRSGRPRWGDNMKLIWDRGEFTGAVRNRPTRTSSRRRPLAVCMSCGNLEFQSEFMGSLCTVKRRGKQCRGFVASASAVGTWERCSHCANVSSLKERKNCSHCNGGRWRCAGPVENSQPVKAGMRARPMATSPQPRP